MFSKSFGYAVRGVLYLSIKKEEKKYIQAEEIAAKLEVPRHFLGKVLKLLAKEGVISSNKGPAGGFCINNKTNAWSLLQLLKITKGMSEMENCVLHFVPCHTIDLCPIHDKIACIRKEVTDNLSTTTIESLLKGNKEKMLKNIISQRSNNLDLLITSISEKTFN